MDPLKKLTATALALSIALAGCIETDGPPILHEVQQSSPCAGEKRKAVSPDVLDAFPTCCNGNAHLIPDFLIPADFRAKLEQDPATGALCVPDEFATNADYEPAPCTSVFGLEGVCLSTCIPEVRDQDIELPRATCAANQVCAPCRDPRTGAESGACNFGEMACHPPPEIDKCAVFEPTPEILEGMQPCSTQTGVARCVGRGHCADATLVPEHQRKDLNLCDDGTSYCVPDDLLMTGGRFQPPTCRAVGGFEGRCLSICVKSVAEQLDMLTVSTCKTDERCAPCYDPRTGQGTGACTVGPCDEAKEPAGTFEPCGKDGGEYAFCIPADLVPAKHRSRFDNRGCGAGCGNPADLCVPKKIMDAGETFAPKECKSGLSGFLALFLTIFSNPIEAFKKMDEYRDGRCLSNCIPQVRDEASLLGKDGCDDNETCVPCYDPQKIAQGKVPTGACDFQ